MVLFISLDSKFWHDLLGILYFYKNAREKLNDGNIYTFDSADAVEEFVKLPYSKIYQNVVAQYPQRFGDSNVLYTLNFKIGQRHLNN